MDRLGADLALAALHPLLDLRHEHVDQLLPRHARIHRPARITRIDIPLNRLRIHPLKLRRSQRAARGVEP